MQDAVNEMYESPWEDFHNRLIEQKCGYKYYNQTRSWRNGGSVTPIDFPEGI